MRKRWIVVGVALMAAVIFVSSSIPYDKQNIQPLLARLVNQDLVTRWFGWVDFMYGTKEISIAHVGVPAFLEFFIRKAAHLLSYALLGYLMSRLLGVVRVYGAGRMRSVRLGWLFCMRHRMRSTRRLPLIVRGHRLMCVWMHVERLLGCGWRGGE